MIQKLQAMKSKKGFTLVELIVVIAIIAVLSAILIPTMMNWAQSAKITSADSNATNIKNQIQAYSTKALNGNGATGFGAGDYIILGEKAAAGTAITYTVNGGTAAITALDAILGEANVTEFETSFTELPISDFAVVVDNGIVVEVFWSENTNILNPFGTAITGTLFTPAITYVSDGMFTSSAETTNTLVGTAAKITATYTCPVGYKS